LPKKIPTRQLNKVAVAAVALGSASFLLAACGSTKNYTGNGEGVTTAKKPSQNPVKKSSTPTKKSATTPAKKSQTTLSATWWDSLPLPYYRHSSNVPLKMPLPEIAALAFTVAQQTFSYQHTITHHEWSYSTVDSWKYATPAYIAQMMALQKTVRAETKGNPYSYEITNQFVSLVTIENVALLKSKPETSTSVYVDVTYSVLDYGLNMPSAGESSGTRNVEYQVQKIGNKWLVAQTVPTNAL
jgi:hypothetical protein